MRERERIVVMNDPQAMRINKELAQEIGFQESVVFLQMEYLIAHSDTVIEGPDGVARRWKRMPLKDLRARHFPWWSEATLLRCLNRLEERSLILVGEHNELGYDRTQWYAVDETGVRELASVAIFQNEKSRLQDDGQQISERNLQTDNLKNADSQNETTIREEVGQEPQETSPNGDAKKSGTSSTRRPPRKTLPKLTDEEAERRWEALCGRDPRGADLRRLAEILAAENETGKVAVTRVWNEIGERYEKARARESLSEEAWAYGFEEAIARQKPSVGYVLPCARGYRPGRDRKPARAGAGGASGAADYDEGGY